jgi:hypothetical protein
MATKINFMFLLILAARDPQECVSAVGRLWSVDESYREGRNISLTG